MDKEKILQDLEYKLYLIERLDTAKRTLKEKQSEFSGNGIACRLGIMVAFLGISLFYGVHFLVIIAMEMALYYSYDVLIPYEEKYLQPFRDEANAIYQAEVNNPEHIISKQGFDSKFYNRNDLNRLWHLINDNRASTLQEACNLLEQQQYHEENLSISRENLQTTKNIESAISHM